MTIKETRILRNMVLIGGTMVTGSFFFSMATFAKSSTPKYEIKPFTGVIKTISNIEDFERTNKCNFVFHESGANNPKSARDYSGGDSEKVKKVVEKAEAERGKCTANRFVYINL